MRRSTVRIHKIWIGILVALVLFACLTSKAQDKLSPDEVNAGWLNLFDGKSTYGWESASGWVIQDQALSSTMAFDKHIVSALPFADFALQFEYRLSATPSGAAVRIRAPRNGEPAESGYRIPLGDSNTDWPAGSIVLRSKSNAPAPSLNQWHSVSIEAEGSHIQVLIDGKPTAETKDESAKGGYIEFESTRGASLDLRSIFIKPLSLNSLFNGTDLSGWKSVPFSPKPGEGMGHMIAKVFGAGNAKPHSAKWSVHDGSIHGESGPGYLETNGSYDDFVLQITGNAVVDEKKKKTAFPDIYLRNDAGSGTSGYALGIGARSGELRGLAQPRGAITAQPSISETVVAGGHVFGVFVNGTLATLFTDTRPEGATTKVGAKTKAGTISLDMPEDVSSVDVRNIAIESIPHPLGGVVSAVAPSQPAVVAAAKPDHEPAETQPAASVAAQTAQIAAALGTPTPQARQQIAQLMSQALKTSDPQQQMQLYDQVVRIDPNNAAAIQGYREASAKVAAQQASQQQQQVQSQQQQQSASERERQVADSLASAQRAFLGGNLKQADQFLSVAERLTPENAMARDLRSRINVALSLRHRLMFLGAGFGGLALLGSGALLWRRRKQVRIPVLQVVQGLDQGRLYPVDRDVVRIGGIAQSGGQKNDIVVRDVEHLISRFHCEVHKRNGNFFLIDTNSSNGTNLNGERVRPNQPVALRKGARIDLGGSAVLRFDFERKRTGTG